MSDIKNVRRWKIEPLNKDDKDEQYNLGCMFFNGAATGEKDYEQAFEWFKKAADQGHGFAQHRLEAMETCK